MAVTTVIKTYKDLIAWQRAYALGLSVYKLTSKFPADERFGLTSQLRRGSISVASNIAEGYGRGSTADYTRFLRVARGALYELQTQMQFAFDLRYIDTETHHEVEKQICECERVLAGLLRALEE